MDNAPLGDQRGVRRSRTYDQSNRLRPNLQRSEWETGTPERVRGLKGLGVKGVNTSPGLRVGARGVLGVDPMHQGDRHSPGTLVRGRRRLGREEVRTGEGVGLCTRAAVRPFDSVTRRVPTGRAVPPTRIDPSTTGVRPLGPDSLGRPGSTRDPTLSSPTVQDPHVHRESQVSPTPPRCGLGATKW